MILWAGRQDNLQRSYFQRLWELIYPWLVYEGVSFFVMMIYLMVKLMTDPGLMQDMNNVTAYMNRMNALIQSDYIVIALFTCLIAIPLMLLFMRLDRKKERKFQMRFERWESTGPASFVCCLILGAAVCVVFNHVLMYSGLYDLLSKNFEPVAEMLYTGNFWLELAVVGVLTPIVEELIFRGLIYRRLRWSLDAKWAMVISALIFAVFHGNLLQGIYAFGIGLLMAYIYERYHHILAPILIHVGANMISVLLSDSGLLDFVYESDETFIIATLIMMVVFVISFYLILTKVVPKRADEDPAVIPDDHRTYY